MFATYKFYTSEYLMGRAPSVPEQEYAFWEAEAEREINSRTFGRLQQDKKLVSEQVKKCTCSIAELLYKSDEMMKQCNGAGPLVSYSNDGESGTFDLSESILTESGKKAKVTDVCRKYLGNTGLLNRVVY